MSQYRHTVGPDPATHQGINLPSSHDDDGPSNKILCNVTSIVITMRITTSTASMLWMYFMWNVSFDLSAFAFQLSSPCRTRYPPFVSVLASTAEQSSDAVEGLDPEEEYKLKEQALVDRGVLEETLMAHTGSTLEASKVKVKEVRGAGRSGGFGGASSSTKSKKAAFKTEAKTHAKVLKKEGVVRIDSVLSAKTADRVREYAYSLRYKSEEEVEAGAVEPRQRFANVLLRKDRCDLTIPLGDEVVTEALDEILRKSAVGQTIEAILGKDATLYELSCLISDPGSQRQVVHPDTPFLDGMGPVLYTCFVALQDVRLDMGPTTWLPKTHTADAHRLFKLDKSSKDELIKTQPSVLGLLPKGSCGIFDSRCLHCGTANQSEDSRALFYFSFKSPKVGYPGNPASIRPELGAAQVTLSDLEEDLDTFSKGKGHPMIDRIAATMK